MKSIYENRNDTLQMISNSNTESVTDSSAQNKSMQREITPEELKKHPGKSIQRETLPEEEKSPR